jgi:hypothetical protein
MGSCPASLFFLGQSSSPLLSCSCPASSQPLGREKPHGESVAATTIEVLNLARRWEPVAQSCIQMSEVIYQRLPALGWCHGLLSEQKESEVKLTVCLSRPWLNKPRPERQGPVLLPLLQKGYLGCNQHTTCVEKRPEDLEIINNSGPLGNSLVIRSVKSVGARSSHPS